MKAALACYLETIRMAQEAGLTLPGDLIVAGTCNEEDLMIGSADWQRRGPTHPLCGTGRFSMNVVRGGTIASAIPDACEMEADRRFLPGEDVADILADYQARLDGLAATMPELRVSLSVPSLEVQPLDVPRDSPLVRALERAVSAVTGEAAVVSAFPGGTDVPNMGCPCVICGPGNLEQAHSRNEYVDITQMEQACAIYFSTILDLGGTGI